MKSKYIKMYSKIKNSYTYILSMYHLILIMGNSIIFGILKKIAPKLHWCKMGQNCHECEFSYKHISKWLPVFTYHTYWVFNS